MGTDKAEIVLFQIKKPSTKDFKNKFWWNLDEPVKNLKIITRP